MPYHVFTTICPTLDIENRVDNQGVDFINASGLRGYSFLSLVCILIPLICKHRLVPEDSSSCSLE